VADHILYINSLRASVRPTRQFRVLIHRQTSDATVPCFNPPAELTVRTGRACIFYGRTGGGPNRWRILGFCHSACINSRSACVCPTRQFCVLIHRRNQPGQSDGRTDRQILYGRTGPDRRPLYNFDQRSLVSQSVSGPSVRVSVCDHWTPRIVRGKRKVTLDAEKSDGKKIRRP